MAAQPLWPDDPVDAIMGVMEHAFDPGFGEAWNRRQVADALVLGTSRHALIAPDGAIGQTPRDRTAGFLLARRALDDEELLLFAIHQLQNPFSGGVLIPSDAFSSALDRLS